MKVSAFVICKGLLLINEQKGMKWKYYHKNNEQKGIERMLMTNLEVTRQKKVVPS